MLGSLFRIPLFRIKPASSPRLVKKRPLKAAPELVFLWNEIAKTYFSEDLHLLEFKVSWSRRRQKRVLASISPDQKTVRVAHELNHPDYFKFLEPLLYHEMCHAVIGAKVERRGRKKLWHGPTFKALEAKHPGMKSLTSWIKSGGWAQAVRRSRARNRTR